jgi:hypothetical protein
MEIDRRSLMRGMLASGALLALGLPSWAFANPSLQRPRQCTLILSGTDSDEAFARGAQSACASMASEGLRTLQLKGGLLGGTDEVGHLLAHASESRIIVILDDASALVFLELARVAGGRLLCLGSHACSTDRACHIRHDLASTSHDYSPGGLLASQLMLGPGSFSIMERYLHDASQGPAVTAWSSPGFCSYRSAEPDSMHLHCSGLSFADGCRLTAVDEAKTWAVIPPQANDRGSMPAPTEHWVESVGYAVTASALGNDSVKESCSCRAFVRRAADHEHIGPQERFMSLVMDL